MKEITEIITLQITTITHANKEEADIVLGKSFIDMSNKVLLEKVEKYFCPDDVQLQVQHFVSDLKEEKK